MKFWHLVLVGFVVGFAVQGLWMNLVGFGIEVFVAGIVILGAVAALSLFPAFRRYGAPALGLLIGWVGGRFILVLIGMAIGVPLSLF
jgi:hypothetical protein